MLSWQNDSQPLADLAPTGLVQLDPLPLKTISARGLCLVRMEFLRAAGSIDVCVVTSPCNHMNALRFMCPRTQFHVFGCDQDGAEEGVTFHEDNFTVAIARAPTYSGAGVRWALLGSGDESLQFHRELLCACPPNAGYLLVVQDLEDSLPSGVLVYPVWGPSRSRAFLLEQVGRAADPAAVQPINMAMLLVELNYFHREVRGYARAVSNTYDVQREEAVIRGCMGDAWLDPLLVELVKGLLPPGPEQEAEHLMRLLFPDTDVSTSSAE